MERDPVKMEFAVEMKCQSCADAVNKALLNISGVESVAINLDKNIVLVDGALSSSRVQELIEQTGRKAVLVGVGVDRVNKAPISAAVAMLSGMDRQRGLARFIATDDDECIVEASVDGIQPGSRHSLTIHEFGDLSDGCQSCGNVLHEFSGGSEVKSYAIASENGRAEFRYKEKPLPLWQLIGRSVVLQEYFLNGTEKRAQIGKISVPV